MLLTFTIDEIRDFERKVTDWSERRGLVAIQIITKYFDDAYGFSMPGQSIDHKRLGNTIRQSLDEWDKLNPEPKLIPKL